jgi:hypothetical protein
MARAGMIEMSLPSALRTRTRGALDRAEQYVRGRQSRNGGFCFYRWEQVDEPNLHDTWHAVATLALLGAEIPRADAVAASLENYEAGGFDHLFHCVYTLDVLDRAADVEARWGERIRALKVRTHHDGNVSASARLETALRIFSLQRRFADIRIEGDIAEFLEGLRSDGGYGDKPNLQDTWLALGIRHLCDLPFDDATRAFVDSLQVARFGFVATRDSMLSNLDVLHAGVNACALLGLVVRHTEDIVTSVLACQTGDGGFARTSDALPNLAYTHLAVQALAQLGAFESAALARLPFALGL